MENALSLLPGSAVSAHVADLPSDAADAVWIRLIPAGTFSGRDGRGPYHAGDEAELQQIAEMTRRYHGETDILVDYEHQSLNSQTNGKPAPAAGWIHAVEARSDGLYGRVEWTANAASSIKAREYRYLSPVYFSSREGRVLALQNVALTNSPNLSLPEVTAHSLFSATKPAEVSMKKVLAALGLADGASEDDVVVAVNSLLTSSTAIALAAGLPRDATTEAIATAVQTTFSDRRKIAVAAGQTEAATTDQIVAALAEAHRAATPDPTKFVPIAQVEAMQADITALQSALREDKAKDAVEAAIRDGKLAPALREWGLDMHRAAPARFDAFVGAAPVLTAQQRATARPPGTGAAVPELNDADLAVMRQMGLSPEDMKSSKASLEDVL